MSTQSELFTLYKDDYSAIDGIETLTVSPRNPKRSDITGVTGKQISIDVSTLGLFAANIALEEIDAVFEVWHTTLGSTITELRNGDLIKDSTDTYVILQANKQDYGTKWLCICRRQTL